VTELTDGTRIRITQKTKLWYPSVEQNVDVEPGREFIAIDRPDENNYGWCLPVVEPDVYASDVVEIHDNSMIVVCDPDSFVIVEDAE
jgi:hypothetical protein